MALDRGVAVLVSVPELGAVAAVWSPGVSDDDVCAPPLERPAAGLSSGVDPSSPDDSWNRERTALLTLRWLC